MSIYYLVTSHAACQPECGIQGYSSNSDRSKRNQDQRARYFYLPSCLLAATLCEDLRPALAIFTDVRLATNKPEHKYLRPEKVISPTGGGVEHA